MSGMDDWSLLPDEHNKWAYGYTDRKRYISPEAVALREARDRAIRSLPEWVLQTGLEKR